MLAQVVIAADHFMREIEETGDSLRAPSQRKNILMDEKALFHMLELLPQIEGLLAKASRIAIKAKGRILFIDPAEVVTVEAQGNCVLLQRMSGSELLREPMSTIAEKLRPYGFVRIHRSVLINASFVEELQPWSSGEYVLRIKGGKEFNVSRTYKRNLHFLTPLWFGTDGFGAG
jgi:two-component system LytT family response regulator